MRWISRIIFSFTLPREDRGLEDSLARRRSSKASSWSFVVMRVRMTAEFMALKESGYRDCGT